MGIVGAVTQLTLCGVSGRRWADTEEQENRCITSPLQHSHRLSRLALLFITLICGKRAWKCTEIDMRSDSAPRGVIHRTSSHIDIFQTRRKTWTMVYEYSVYVKSLPTLAWRERNTWIETDSRCVWIWFKQQLEGTVQN